MVGIIQGHIHNIIKIQEIHNSNPIIYDSDIFIHNKSPIINHIHHSNISTIQNDGWYDLKQSGEGAMKEA